MISGLSIVWIDLSGNGTGDEANVTVDVCSLCAGMRSSFESGRMIPQKEVHGRAFRLCGI